MYFAKKLEKDFFVIQKVFVYLVFYQWLWSNEAFPAFMLTFVNQEHIHPGW